MTWKLFSRHSDQIEQLSARLDDNQASLQFFQQSIDGHFAEIKTALSKLDNASGEPRARQHGPEKNSSDTTEYFEPSLGLEVEPYIEKNLKQGIHHLGRYHWAKSVLAELEAKTVLDIACGAGYGSYILANYLPEATITGAEYDRRGLELARGQWQNHNLSYVQGNIVTWEKTESDQVSGLGKFDAIVSFDTIEHLLHREIALIRITQNLQADGALLLSTPCAHSETRLNPGWEHHKIEYSHHDLVNLLKRFFEEVIVPDDVVFPNKRYWDQVINKDEMRYLNRANPIVCKRPLCF